VRSLLAVLLAAALLAGCGGSDDYCAAVKEHQAELSEIAASGDAGAIFDALPAYRELQAAAPSDLSDEWTQVIGRLTTLETALEDAGVDPSSYDPKKPPADLTDEQRAAIEGAARDLGEPATVRAMTGIEQQALDVCKTPLSQ
jgi:hypothetical protein